MKLSNILLALFIGALLATTITACSKGESPVEPVIDNVPISFGTESENRSVLAVYDAVIDPDEKTFTVEPANRTAEYHFPLTQLYPDVLQITGYGWTPNFWADIKLVHPLPGSGIDAFDPRVIAILPANEGVSCRYPIFNVQASNSMIMQPDGYTKLFDSLNPSIPGNTNPFIAYFKEESNRIWSSTGMTDETQRWEMDFPDFGGPIQFSLVVDVSTSYPNPPQPGIDNALEPVQAQIEIGDGLTPTGGEATVTATFLDWQGPDEIKCKVESPVLFNNAVQLFYSGPGSNPDEYVFTGTISNELCAPYGNYMMLLAAWDINAGNHQFIETIASVKIPFNPIDVTPEIFNLTPNCIFVQDQYLYAACEEDATHIFDISDPLNPVWISAIELCRPTVITVSGGYAYVVDGYGDIQIIDIDPPESAHVVNEVDSAGSTTIQIAGEYAYALKAKEVHIYDIDPPESIHLVNTVETPDSAYDISIYNGYAMVACDDEDLQIYDIDPPESASWVSSVELVYAKARGVVAKEGYAYVVSSYYKFFIVDIDPPEAAHIVKKLDTHHKFEDISVVDGYAYLACEDDGVVIVDIDPIDSAHVVHQVETPREALKICIDGDYAYVLTDVSSYEIIDIQTPESAYIVNTINTTCNAQELFVSGDYVYLASGKSGLQIVDIDPPESPCLVNTIYTSDRALDVFVSDGYAYIADHWGDLIIIDIDPAESAYIVKSVVLPGDASSVCVSGDYAYVSNQSKEVIIIDIEPPESAYIANTVVAVPTLGSADKIFISGDYAYVTNSYRRLHILDISSPESAYLAATVLCIPGTPTNIYVTGGYAYVASKDEGLQIIDIDPVESARIVNSIYTVDQANDIFIADGYAYMTIGNLFANLQIFSVKPPEHVHLVQSFGTYPFPVNRVRVSNGYAYMTGLESGLRIIDLW